MFSVGYQELQSLRYSVPIFSKTLLKKKSLCYDNCPKKMGGKNSSNFPGGKNGHPTFEWRESIHANPEYTKKSETKCQLLPFYCTIWQTLKINPNPIPRCVWKPGGRSKSFVIMIRGYDWYPKLLPFHLHQLVLAWLNSLKLTSKAPEKWWLEDDPFLLGCGLFSWAKCWL